MQYLIFTLFFGAVSSFAVYEETGSSYSILVGNTRGDNIVEYSSSGEYIGEFISADSGLLDSPDDIVKYGDNIYVSTGTTPENSAIMKFSLDGTGGEIFASGNGMYRPYGFTFYSGILYVSSFMSDQILMYDASTGEYMDVLAAGDGTAEGLVNGPNDMAVGPDGRLYVTTQGSTVISGSLEYQFSSEVIVFDLSGSAEPQVFITDVEAVPNGFVSLLGIIFEDNYLFVSDFGGGVRKYSTDGTLMTTYQTAIPDETGTFVGNLAFAPDGYLYVVSFVPNDDDGNQGAIQTLDSDAQALEIFIPKNTNLVRPVGILILES